MSCSQFINEEDKRKSIMLALNTTQLLNLEKHFSAPVAFDMKYRHMYVLPPTSVITKRAFSDLQKLYTSTLSAKSYPKRRKFWPKRNFTTM